MLQGAALVLVHLMAACDPEMLPAEDGDASEGESAPTEFRARIPADKAKALGIPADLHDARIVVKFAEGSAVEHDGKTLRRARLAPAGAAASRIDGDLERVQRAYDARGLRLDPLFKQSKRELAALKREGERKSRRQLADLSLYYETPVSGVERGDLQALLTELNALDTVEIAYVRPKAEVAALAPPDANTPDFTVDQGYLNDDDNGIAVAAAHGLSGGRGEHVRIIDVEGSWVEDHEDLPAPFYHHGIDSTDQRWENHGTAVAGVMVAQDNGFGVTGIVPDAAIGYSGIFGATPEGWTSSSQAIINAANQLGAGDIILIELHAQGPTTVTCTCNFDQCNYVPMEFFQAEFDAIQTATANGIVVVEAAGNGSIDLDHATYAGVFDRNVRDSGAIMVGASLSGARTPACFTNHGARVDLHAWGENVMTTGYGGAYTGALGPRDEYTSTFSGTSSASPIVVGAAAAIQSIAIERGEGPLTADEIRDLLVASGTPQDPLTLDRPIGPLPDLAEAVAQAGWVEGSTDPTLSCDLNGGNAGWGGFGIHWASVTNVGNAPLQGWSVDIDFGSAIPDPDFVYGGTYTIAGSVLTIHGTNTLQPGQTANFGVGGSYSGPTPSALTCE